LLLLLETSLLMLTCLPPVQPPWHTAAVKLVLVGGNKRGG